MSTLLITIVPSFLILIFFFLSDKFKEPKKTVALVFALGVLICFPAGILNGFVEENLQSKFSKELIWSFLGPAWTEELLKFLVLYLIVLKRDEFNEPMDGIVYGVVVSLGFATYENYDYVYRIAETMKIDPGQLAIWRSYTAIPLHGLNGCIMGFYFGKYVFTTEKKYLILSLLLPYLLHGSYNYFGFPASLCIVAGMLFYALKLNSDLKNLQKNKKKEEEIKKV